MDGWMDVENLGSSQAKTSVLQESDFPLEAGLIFDFCPTLSNKSPPRRSCIVKVNVAEHASPSCIMMPNDEHSSWP